MWEGETKRTKLTMANNNNDDDLLVMMKKKTQPSPSPLTSAESSTWGMKFRAMFCCGGWGYDDDEDDDYDSSRRSIEIVSSFLSLSPE